MNTRTTVLIIRIEPVKCVYKQNKTLSPVELGREDKLETFTFYFLMDLKIWRRSNPCQRRQKIKIDPCSKAYGKCKKTKNKNKNLNSLSTMVKMYSNKPKINHLDN